MLLFVWLFMTWVLFNLCRIVLAQHTSPLSAVKLSVDRSFCILSKLDPPDSHCLFLKGATVAFLNDEVWNLSNVQQGKYLYILFPTDLSFWLDIYLVLS